MAKRKLTPLQSWRRNYAEISFVIRSAKQAARNGHTWGDFKRPAAQRLAAVMRVTARMMMEDRVNAAIITAAMWKADSIKRAARLGHPIPNSTSPDTKVED